MNQASSDGNAKEALQQNKAALQERIKDLEKLQASEDKNAQANGIRSSRSRSRSPIQKIDPYRDLSPPRWTRSAATNNQVSAEPLLAIVPAPSTSCASSSAMAPMAPPTTTMSNMMQMGGVGMMPMQGMPCMGMMPMMGMNSMVMPFGMSIPMPGVPAMGVAPMDPLAGVSADSGQLQAMRPSQDTDQAYRKAMEVIKAGAVASDYAEDTASSSVSSASRSDVNNPAYRPPNTEMIHGVTDKRWEGLIRLFIEDSVHGYGFIKCKELAKKFPDKDVFLHRNQRNGFRQGDTVSFSIFMNFRGMPQATDLKRAVPQSEQVP